MMKRNENPEHLSAKQAGGGDEGCLGFPSVLGERAVLGPRPREERCSKCKQFLFLTRARGTAGRAGRVSLAGLLSVRINGKSRNPG